MRSLLSDLTPKRRPLLRQQTGLGTPGLKTFIAKQCVKTAQPPDARALTARLARLFAVAVRGATSLAIIGSWCLFAAGCNYFQEVFGPAAPVERGFQLVGTAGLPFSATITDLDSSWQIQGAVPLTIIVINGTPNVRMVVTKLRNDAFSLMSVDALGGSSIIYANEASQPYATTQLQLTGTVPVISPPANPDIRYLVLGPYGMVINGTIEDQSSLFQITATAPVIFIFEHPNGPTTAQLTENNLGFGPMTVELFQNGVMTSTVTNGPNVLIPPHPAT